MSSPPSSAASLDKYRAVLESLATEFTAHAANLRTALRDADIPAIRALRHRMHTALVQMKLLTLTKDLESLTAGGTIHADTALHQRCLTALQSVSTFLSHQASAVT